MRASRRGPSVAGKRRSGRIGRAWGALGVLVLAAGCGRGKEPVVIERTSSALTQLSSTGWIASASSTASGDAPQNALDGVATTRWSNGASQTGSEWFMVDMLSARSFNELTLDAGTTTGGYPATFNVFVSSDGTTWGAAVATGTGSAQLTDIKFLTQSARYLKITQTGTSGNPWAIHELGVWIGTQPCDTLTCTASDQCHVAGTCNPQTGTCTNPAKANGTSCNDANACTQTDTCQSGTCTGSSPVTCTALDQCHIAGTCNTSTGVCTNPIIGNNTPCNDNLPCTTSDLCRGGVCTGTAVVCAASDQCHTAGTCDTSTGVCSNPLAADGTGCNDGNACTQADTCAAGVCTGSSPLSCTAGDVCHVASCDSTAGQAPYPTNGLMGLWHLDGNVKDASDGDNTFTTAVATDAVPGKVGQAVHFGCASMLGNYSNDLSTNTTGIAFVAWMKPSATCPGSWPVFQRSTEFGVQLSCTGSGAPGVSVAVNTGSGLTYSAPYGSLPQDQWSQVIVNWDKQAVTIYINGQQVGSFQRTGNIVAAPLSSYMYLGCYNTIFAGALDEVAVYTRALTGLDITAIATPTSACKTAPKCGDPDACNSGVCDAATGACSSTPKADGTSCSDGKVCTQGDTCHAGACTSGSPVSCAAPSGLCNESTCDPHYTPLAASDYIGLWHLDGDVTDASGNGNDMTNGQTVQAVPGEVNQGMHFDAATSCIYRNAAPNNNIAGTPGVTFATWVKPDATICPSSGTKILFQRNNEFGVALVCKADNTVGVSMYVSLNGGISWSTPVGTVPIGQWSHIAAMWTRSSPYIYINGAYVWSNTYANNADLFNQQSWTMYLGCNTGAAMDEAMLLRRTLNGTELWNLSHSPTLCNAHPKTCVAADTCHAAGTCDASTGVCSNPSRADGSLCSDGNACTKGETCSAGTCGGGSNVNVSCAGPPDQCKQNGVCDPNQAPAPPQNGIVGLWHLDGDLHDSGPNGLDLTNYGAQPTGGKVGSAYDFDGTSCLQIPYLFNQGLNLSAASGITMMAWIRPDPSLTPTGAAYPTVLAKQGDFSLATYWNGTQVPGPGVTGHPGTTTSPTPSYPSPGGATPPGTWAHIAVTWDKATHNYASYFNGAMVYGWAGFTGSLVSNSSIFSIGCLPGPWGNFPNFKGTIDEAVVYNRALSASELQSYVASVNTATCTWPNKPNGASCTDGNACTQGDSCQSGACAAGAPVTCTAQDACHVAGTCAPGTGACSNPVAADGTSCNDNNACTQADTCHAGACVGANPVTCVASDGCHVAGTCVPSTGACSSPIRPGGSCTLGSGAGGGAWAPTIYEPAAGKDCSEATGINSIGSIVGYSDACVAPPWADTQSAAPFAVVNGVTTQLPVPAGTVTFFPSTISDSGYVLGNALGASGTSSAYVYPADTLTQPQLLPFPAAGGRVYASATIPYTANPAVAGQAADSSGVSWQWALYDVQDVSNAPGQVRTLPPPPYLGGTGAALSLNEAGDTVGYYTGPGGDSSAMISIAGGTVQSIGGLVHTALLDGWDLQFATAINAHDQVVGYGSHNGRSAAFEMSVITEMLVDLGTLPPPYDNLSYHPTAINSTGIIVGTAGIEADTSGLHLEAQRAWVYTNVLHDLNEFVSLPTGWVLASAVGINDNNEIAGVATGPGGVRTAYKVQLQGTLPQVPPLQCTGPVDGDPGWALVHSLPTNCGL